MFVVEPSIFEEIEWDTEQRMSFLHQQIKEAILSDPINRWQNKLEFGSCFLTHITNLLLLRFHC